MMPPTLFTTEIGHKSTPSVLLAVVDFDAELHYT